ncbi:MAG: sulfatase-like hydrolase/transferase [Saprospiraceae bacterium]|nr:sulfatase-like hydrolase/transferase [Saprospiraceae bacterium]
MSNLNFLLAVIIFVFSITSCSKGDNNLVPTTTSTPNILLIIADDLGKDAINGYQEGSIKPNTPNIDVIRNNGLMFTNFWVNPTCTPTRSSIITGKYGYRTGVKGVGDVLNSSETVIQKYINDNTNNKYATAVVGKWHLSGNSTGFNPETFGIDYYAGLIRGTVDDYYQWQLTEDGGTSQQTTYITEKLTDLAINWVNNQSKPWFLWLAYNAPHTPFHVPPSNMHSQGNLPAYTNGMDATPYFMASIEAMDYQIGRFLASIPADEKENTIIIFLGDNGTTNLVAQSPYSNTKVKNTLYQGGINTPLFISGKEVSRTGSDNQLLAGTDLFATLAQIAGINVNEYHDSKSFKTLFSQSSSIRNYQYSELKDGSAESWTISNGKHKLLIKSTGNEEMYHLTNDPYEQNNLLNGALSSTEQSAKLELEVELNNIRQ